MAALLTPATHGGELVSLTHNFIAWTLRNDLPRGARVLDFGCGAGEVVSLLLQDGLDAHGVDTFDGVWRQYAAPAGRLPGRIRRVARGAALPFEDGTFDAVVTNQVMEHVADPERVVRELARVTRPGGLLLSIYPTSEILVEPHVKVPLVHRFPARPAVQRGILTCSWLLGIGRGRVADRRAWVAGTMSSLRDETFYLSLAASIGQHAPWFELEDRREPDWPSDREAVRFGHLRFCGNSMLGLSVSARLRCRSHIKHGRSPEAQGGHR